MHRARIESASLKAACIWDKASQEDFESRLDQVIGSDKVLLCADINEIYREHYINRILKPGRFTRAALLELLNLHYDRSSSVKENLIRVGRKTIASDNFMFLQNLKVLEHKNSKILAVGDDFRLGS